MPETFTIAANDVEVVVDDLGLPHNKQPHTWKSVGETRTARRAFIEEVHERLQKERLFNGTDYDDDVQAAMNIWTKPEILVIVRALHTPDETTKQHIRYRACANQHWAAISRQIAGNDDITFTLFPADEFPTRIAGELPAGFGPIPAEPYSVLLENGKPTSQDDSTQVEIFDEETGQERGTMEPFRQHTILLDGYYELHLRRIEGSRPERQGTMHFWFTDGGAFIGRDRPVNDTKKWLELIPSDGISHIHRWLSESIDNHRTHAV